MKNVDFLLKSVGFIRVEAESDGTGYDYGEEVAIFINIDEFSIENDGFCMNNDAFCIENDGFCMNNDEFCIENDDLNRNVQEVLL